MRRWLIAIAAVIVFVVAFIRFATVAAWVGRKTLPVEIHVIDIGNQSAITNAQVTIFRGPKTPFEGQSLPPAADFSTVRETAEPVIAKTDLNGKCSLHYSFFAAGKDGYFRHSGYVDTRGAWLEVSAPHYTTTLMPLDRQGVHPRDIRDDTPMAITVVLSKCIYDNSAQ
jgi:hypothetical protein